MLNSNNFTEKSYVRTLAYHTHLNQITHRLLSILQKISPSQNVVDKGDDQKGVFQRNWTKRDLYMTFLIQ